MRTADQQLIKNLVLNEISLEEFLKRFSMDVRNDEHAVSKILKLASMDKDPELLEYSLGVGFKYFGFDSECVPVLNRLLSENWHISHEDIASLLQKFRDPSSVEVLFDTAQREFKYLEYDDAFALAVKCIWALGDIDTELSRQKLKLLANSENEIIKKNAQYQINLRS